MKHSITIRIDEHLRKSLDDVADRTNQRIVSILVRQLLQSSIDRWNSLDDKQLKEEMQRLVRDEWDRFYDRK